MSKVDTRAKLLLIQRKSEGLRTSTCMGLLDDTAAPGEATRASLKVHSVLVVPRLAQPDGAAAIRRRAVLAASGVAVGWPSGLWAQRHDKPWRIAFLTAGGTPRAGQLSTFDAVRTGLRERGYAAMQMRAWYADSRAESLSALAQQVLAWQPDLIIAQLTPAQLAAQRATQTIPIVLSGSGDPVATGLVQSLAPAGRQCHWRLRAEPRAGGQKHRADARAAARAAPPGCAGACQ